MFNHTNTSTQQCPHLIKLNMLKLLVLPPRIIAGRYWTHKRNRDGITHHYLSLHKCIWSAETSYIDCMPCIWGLPWGKSLSWPLCVHTNSYNRLNIQDTASLRALHLCHTHAGSDLPCVNTNCNCKASTQMQPTQGYGWMLHVFLQSLTTYWIYMSINVRNL